MVMTTTTPPNKRFNWKVTLLNGLQCVQFQIEIRRIRCDESRWKSARKCTKNCMPCIKGMWPWWAQNLRPGYDHVIFVGGYLVFSGRCQLTMTSMSNIKEVLFLFFYMRFISKFKHSLQQVRYKPSLRVAASRPISCSMAAAVVTVRTMSNTASHYNHGK